MFIKNYNLETIQDGKINPVASLICTIFLEIAQMERLLLQKEWRRDVNSTLTIVERMESRWDDHNHIARQTKNFWRIMQRNYLYSKKDCHSAISIQLRELLYQQYESCINTYPIEMEILSKP